MKNAFFSIVALTLIHLTLNAQTICPNALSNGNFELGNTGFTSGLTPNCGCAVGTWCVNTNLTTKCPGWPNLGAQSGSNFLIIDGSPAANTDVWTATVPSSPGVPYIFSFYVASVFPPAQQVFDLAMMVNGVNVSQVTVSQASPTWTKYSFSGFCPAGLSSMQIAIRQLTGGGFRDFGLDNIYFACCPCDASFNFANIAPSCDSFQFTNTSTNPFPLTYSWDFGDPNSGVNNTSSIPNPIHQFSSCGTFNVCLIIVGDGCRDTVCRTVTVSDITPPIARCKPGVGVVLNPNCQYNVTTAFVDNGSTDDCLIKSLTVNPAIIIGCGNTTVTLTVTDWCNNRSTCTMGIQTIETVPPTIVCPPNATVTCAKDTIPSVTGTATATDNCPGTITFTQSDLVSGNMPCDATVRRTWTATDACGNSSSCVQIIFVRDNVPPIITNCPTSQTVNVNAGVCYYTFPTPLVITATDCDPNPTITCTWTDPLGIVLPLTAQTQFPKGVNTIKCIARDKCGNVSRDCIFTLTVRDNQPPTILCPKNIVVVGSLTPPPAQLCKAIINGLTPLVTDNCPMVTVGYTITSITNGTTASGSNDASGTNFMGTSSVVYTATDMGGNTKTCSFTVTVSCDSCACSPNSPSSQNLIANGNFSLGNIGFTSTLTYDNNIGGGIGCGAGRYGVYPNFTNFCTGWPSLLDHTNNANRQYMTIDGSDFLGGVLWQNQTPFNVLPNTNYCFSFWWASAYPTATQSFPISIDIVNAIGVPVSAMGTETIAQTPAGIWTKKTISWNSGTLTGLQYVAIRQLTPSSQRDFGIDDICFTKAPVACSADFNFLADSCGKYTFNGFANGTPNFTYTWNFGDPGSGATNIVTGTSTTQVLPVQMHQFSVGGNHLVTLTITDAAGCTITYSVTITVPPLPSANITGNLSICSGQSTTLSASGGSGTYTYAWSPGGATTASITVSPITTTTYIVTVKDLSGCPSKDTVTVVVKPIPAFLLSNQTICPRQSATLTASGGGTYLWSPGGQTTASITVTPSVTTTYSCSVTTNSCTGTASATVTVIPINISSQLTGYFPFNGNANDVSPTAINGIPTNVTPVLALNGTTPSAYNFNGTSSVIICTPDTRGVTDKVSVVAWVKTSELARGMWVAGQYNGGQARGYLLSIGDIVNGNIGQASFSGRVNLSAYYAAISPPSVKVNNGQWHCIVGTAGLGISGTTEWRIYVDGILRDNISGLTTPSIAPAAGSTHFTIGRHSDANLPLIYYNGDMDDVRVYNKVLTPCEVDSICSIRIVSGLGDVYDRMQIFIYPNPNGGTFTVELPQAAKSNMNLRITDFTGRFLLQKQTEAGKQIQTMEAADLPNGLYFLQVVSDGKVVGVEKFVKQ